MKIVIAGGGAHIPPLDGPAVEKRVLEFKRVNVSDMDSVVKMIKRSKTAQHKELMRRGRNEFHKKGKF